ncbi:hypothetical protein PGT21_019700 [Puccinia graminis f. sp. tritici]|uniref:Ferric oxidoreductase domain-containing protein n=2 Tax=Puccinia graminis f. sp. tritici TaxID=56615 RepID=E3KF73_PUCGT|nr:uncharacterized protein PGTG_09868 [Puccinia graminis f. sp. tritici CRL 75-36-700-3]EFP82900.2 hypothetical protein PGTG_09868 [Puccinia graminis f. sp. tritici CRL 75-36-700-3]KAA1069285.1 hypothetical protein PGT21_019700 [Puccinia graminis f. sp. tritici]
MLASSNHSSSLKSYSSLSVAQLESAEVPAASLDNPCEKSPLCGNRETNSESSSISDSESNHGHDSHTEYDSHSDSSPTVIDHGVDHTVIDLETQYEHSREGPHENKKVDKHASSTPWKHEFEDSHPYIAPTINRWTMLITWFTPYRQLFVLTFTVNLIGAILELSGHWAWSKDHVTPLVVGNVLIAIAIRSEWVLRFLYWVTVKTFRPNVFPLWLRVKVVGILYHIGGVHSGCGLSALLWLVVAASAEFQQAHLHHVTSLVALGICLACVSLTCLSAFPFIRGRFHNVFEMIHRFVGWIGIVFTVLYVILESLWDVGEQRWDPRASRLMTKPELWFLVTIFIIIVFSWITIAKVPVTVYTSSDKASVIRVPGGLTSGLHTRISVGGLREWHIFGSISEGKNAEYHYIVAAVQGEFTKMLNVDKPVTLYTKRWKPCGLPYFSRLFKRGLAMCTGSGIGAVASTCIQHDNWFLIWIGPNLEKTYGKEIMQLICDRIPESRRLIWDTRGPLGRPDVVRLLQNTYLYWEAEVTLFVGSPEMNSNVLQSCRALKTPVFGSIWDA